MLDGEVVRVSYRYYIYRASASTPIVHNWSGFVSDGGETGRSRR